MVARPLPSMAGYIAQALQMSQISAEEHRHLTELQKRWDAYYGKHPRMLRTRPGGPNDNVQINFTKAIVNKGVAFLFGQPLRFELDRKTTEETPEEKWLRLAWQHNRLMSTLQKIGLNGGVTGHAFVKLVPAKKEAGELYPRVIVLNPSDVSAFWDEDDIDKVLEFKIQYNTIDNETRKPIVKRQLITRNPDEQAWTITDYEWNPEFPSNDWKQTNQEDWPYPWAPVFHCQNLPNPGSFWGVSDLEEDVRLHNYSINFLASNTLRIIRNHAHPKVWAKATGNNEKLDLSPDQIATLASPDAEIHQLEMKGDLEGSLQYLRWTVEQLLAISQVPEIALGKSDTPGNLSAPALRIKFQSLIEKTEVKRTTYGDMLRELCYRMLELNGMSLTVEATDDEGLTTNSDRELTILWPELIAGDPIQERQAAQIDHQLGASEETILRKLGYDPALEAQRSEQEHTRDVKQQQELFAAQGGIAAVGNRNNGLDQRAPGQPGRPTSQQSGNRPRQPGRADNSRGNAG